MRVRLTLLIVVVLWPFKVSGGSEPPLLVPAKIDLFDLAHVRLLDGPFKRHQELCRQYLLKLEPDRLLNGCLREAGLKPKAPPYGGWESTPGVSPGQILGFYLSAASMMVQSTDDAELRTRLDYVLAELDQVQKANGNGYLMAIPGGKQLFGDVARGKIEVGGLPWNGCGLNGWNGPAYVLNKIMLGLYQAHLATGNPRAKAILVRTADWFGQEILDKLNDEQVQHLLEAEHGSLNESFADVYALTGDARYLAWARRLCHRQMLEPLAAQHDILTNWHANTQIPKFTGFQRIYTFTGEKKLLAAARFFWETVVSNRSWAIGGNSADERFNDPRGFDAALKSLNGSETCNSVNMLRLTEPLYSACNEVHMLDAYERTLYNHILASHDPERGMFVYYSSMRPGHYRVYSDEFNSMWCCVGTGMESPGKYGKMIYARSPGDDALHVNLFIASELNWKSKGVRLRQETRFPDEAATTLRMSCDQPVRFALKIRHPAWVPAGAVKIAVNGQLRDIDSRPGAYLTLERSWRSGDVVRLELPMHLSLEYLPHDSSFAAVLYGPVVLAGSLGSQDIPRAEFWSADPTAHRVRATSKVPVFVSPTEDILSRVHRVPGETLTFRTDGLGQPDDVQLRPFYETHFQRYVVYWRLMSSADWQREQAWRAETQRREQELNARTVDLVDIGVVKSETAHALKSERSDSGNAGREHGEWRWRHATDGGSFSYEMNVLPDQPMELRCIYWGKESGARRFDILVDDTRVATTSLDSRRGEVFYDVIYPLASSLTARKTRVIVKFQAHPQNTAGGVFGLRMLSSRGIPSGAVPAHAAGP